MSDTQTHSHMALLVMDMQVGIVTRYAQTGDFLTHVNTAITSARAASIPVIYVAVAFRPGYPEVSPRNKSFSAIKQQQSSLSAPMTATEIHLLLSKVFPRQAEVLQAEAWRTKLNPEEIE